MDTLSHYRYRPSGGRRFSRNSFRAPGACFWCYFVNFAPPRGGIARRAFLPAARWPRMATALCAKPQAARLNVAYLFHPL